MTARQTRIRKEAESPGIQESGQKLSRSQVADRQPVGQRISALRKQRGLTLLQVAGECGISEATLSRIENGQTGVSAEHLFVMAQLFGVDMADFFRHDAAPLMKGMRSIIRKGEAGLHPLARYASELLHTDISSKHMLPAINHVTARTLAETGGLQAHAGEEFVFVLSGTLSLHSELYTPAILKAGDSCYFEGSMAHAYLNTGVEDEVVILVVVRADEAGPG
jgi:transcriptional regulator with XRE-family HTH domain